MVTVSSLRRAGTRKPHPLSRTISTALVAVMCNWIVMVVALAYLTMVLGLTWLLGKVEKYLAKENR